MSLQNQQPEREPQLITPVRRYYCDIYYAYKNQTNIADVMMALERLLESEGIVDDVYDQRGVRNIVLAIDAQPMIDQQKFEANMILPIALCGPYIESAWTPARVIKWYSNIAGNIIGMSKNIHDTVLCVEEANNYEGVGCVHSDRCPIIALTDYLTKPVAMADFTDISYDIDPLHTFQIAKNKALLALGYKLGDAVHIERCIDSYTEHATVLFGSNNGIESPETHT
jgi:hypothetical protein